MHALEGIKVIDVAINYAGPSSVQSPPYPFLLAVLFKIFGPDSAGAYVAAMLINSIAGALTVWLVWKLVIAMGGSRRAALIAAAQQRRDSIRLMIRRNEPVHPGQSATDCRRSGRTRRAHH